MPTDPLSWLDDELSQLDARHLLPPKISHSGPQGATIVLDGQALVNFGANDYLGLAADPRLSAAAARAAQQEGWGAGASPLVTGHGASHAELERQLAEFEGTEAALLFSSGFAANLGTVAALVERGDAIFADAKNHASLIDGCRLSRAEVHIYRHGDVDHLSEMLRIASGYRRRLIVTDSLFSMDGDFAPLAANRGIGRASIEAMLLIDEAHATGVFGQQGRGVAEMLGVEDGVHIRIGTLSKALGSIGGFAVGRQSLIDWLFNRARSYVFSTAFPPAVAAAAIAALQMVRDEPQRRTELLVRAQSIREQLAAQGWNVGQSASQIIPVYLGEPDRTMRVAQQLRARGLFVPGIRPPTVPPGESLLRISLSWSHSAGMLDQLLAVLADCCTS